MLFVTDQIIIPDSELEFSFVRSSGPGGQNVNKVNSKAQMRWDFQGSQSLPLGVRQRFREQFGNRLTVAGELIIGSDNYRDRMRNQDDCREKLKQMLLLVAHPPKVRRKTKPSRGSQERAKVAKKKHGEKKKGRNRSGWGD